MSEPDEDEMVAAVEAHLAATGWQPIETAPKDGTWLLLRGRNSAGHPMIPVVAAWKPAGAPSYRGWVDSGTFKPVDDLAVEWHPLPTSIGADDA